MLIKVDDMRDLITEMLYRTAEDEVIINDKDMMVAEITEENIATLKVVMDTGQSFQVTVIETE